MIHSSRQLLAIILMLALMSGWILVSTQVCASARDNSESCVNVSLGRNVGIGVYFVHDDIGFCIKNWTTNTTAMCSCFLAPSGGGNPRVLAKAQEKLVDTCYLDGYMAIGAEIPIASNINWQRFDGTVGIEWSFPDISDFASSVEAGISLVHYYHCDWWSCEWLWRSESFIGIGLDFYF